MSTGAAPVHPDTGIPLNPGFRVEHYALDLADRGRPEHGVATPHLDALFGARLDRAAPPPFPADPAAPGVDPHAAPAAGGPGGGA